MIYLKSFKLLDDYKEHGALDPRRIHNNIYPLHIFPEMELEDIRFEGITIFYGGNGSGKSTLLNIIASKLNATRMSKIEKGANFQIYVDLCEYELSIENPLEIKAITSDDVFDYLLDIRAINSHVHRRKERLSEEYLENKFDPKDDNFQNYNKVKDISDARSKTMSKYIRERLTNNNLIEQSNGESALMFWEKEIKEDSIYILDEPENSLLAENQLKLKQFIEDSARFYNCQFIISTHSPFLLSLIGAKVYDLDSRPARVRDWTELSNVRIYYDFFKENESKFEE